MRLITSHELANRTHEELQLLFNAISQELARTEAGMSERRNDLANLENIGRAMCRMHKKLGL